ncbi:MAG: serine/threonine protein phosphatase [Lewinellaceae bacterium]|nr:serine/threonine protein phosphatase [Lewinellaceae bacterium]
MSRSYAIGDIHGCNRTLQALLRQLSLVKGDILIFLGDYIDRGPDSRGVIDTIFSLQERGVRTICLRGNHEQLLLNSRTDPTWLNRWTISGGEEALQSFGVDHPIDIPEPYISFFEKTLFAYEIGPYICVHGGIDMNSIAPLEEPEVLMRARNWYKDINYAWLGDRIVLHGHTPEAMDTILLQHALLDEQQYLCLDNGCVYAMRRDQARPGLGRLLAFCLETEALFEHAYCE